MGLCSGAWERLSAMMGETVSSPQIKKVTGKAKCPGCGKEFDVELKVEQSVAGSVLDFNVAPVSNLTDLCPWNVKK